VGADRWVRPHRSARSTSPLALTPPSAGRAMGIPYAARALVGCTPEPMVAASRTIWVVMCPLLIVPSATMGRALGIAVRAGAGGVSSLRNWGLGSMGGITPARDASSTSSLKVRRTRCGCSNVRHPATTRFGVRPVANECPKGRTIARCADMTSVTTCRKARRRSRNTAGGGIGLRLLADESSAIDRVGVHPQSAGSALRTSPNTTR
jgi:hypothetical protein